jgi:DNA-binding transcriptional MerR regulator
MRVTARPGALRIGEFARRVDVSPDLLRAWERRYGLLRPLRSPGGFRLYTDDDAARVGRMRRALSDGLSAAEAARVALEPEPQPPSEGLLDDAAERLFAAIERYDEAAIHAVLDETLTAFGLETALGALILPTLVRIGVAWENGELEISHEHFASNLIRGRLLALARLWSRGDGPIALLAAPPGEAHDLNLLAFGLVLRSHGWRIIFLGADTPVATLTHTAETTRPALIVLATFDPTLLEAHSTALRRLAKTVPMLIAGPGVQPSLAARIGAQLDDDDLINAAARVAHRNQRA